jgi:hypothetical protein
MGHSSLSRFAIGDRDCGECGAGDQRSSGAEKVKALFDGMSIKEGLRL